DLVCLLTPSGERTAQPSTRITDEAAQLADFYRDMVLIRRMDTEAYALQRHGELGLWAPLFGQEAAQIGAGRALATQDWVFPSYREHGIGWCRGIGPEQLLGTFRGTEMSGWDPNEYRYAFGQIIIGAQTLHGVGYAIGLQLDGLVGNDDPSRDTAVLTAFGDGATSQGAVAEAMMWAASHQAPVVFFCQNNHYAISVPVSRQSRTPLADRAKGFGFDGVRVDGNDVLACYDTVGAALDKARAGGGPTLIEAVTYRRGPHTTSDDPSRYRESLEEQDWAKRDPIDRVRLRLEALGTAPDFFAAIDAEAETLGARTRAACLALPEPDLGELFDNVFVEPDAHLRAQQAEYRSWNHLTGGAA
ncbi:MAG: thiamine pyrophosphate-dependent dehydrogenase E1 component subunit alpha, partial [Actinomycetales bacterium]|nr:thiamine pyrophosphate-dependent dehydrogenase E1 component subunit alpha [Actinomycetales bacterium]